MKIFGFLLGAAAVAILAAFPAAACTGITVKAQDGAVIHARTMEAAPDMHSQVLLFPRGYALTAQGPGDKPGIKWKVKYAAIGLNSFGFTDLADGMNEKGLSAGLFFLPGFTEHQKVTPADQDKCLAPWNVATWILTNFATVDEVRAALPKVRVWAGILPQMAPGPLPQHYMITDKEGNSLVVEYVGGELKMYDNPLGVITNSPPFDWHLLNLRNYMNLSANNVPKLQLKGMNIYPAGQGSGMLGLPGDVTPPSRFVRAVAFTQAVLPSANAEEAVMASLRLLNSFFISKGMARDWADGEVYYDITQWIVANDLQNRRLYFFSYNDLTPKVVDLNRLDLDAATLKRIPITSGPRFKDVTGLAK